MTKGAAILKIYYKGMMLEFYKDIRSEICCTNWEVPTALLN